MIDGAIRSGVPGPLRVLGEISNFTDRTHWYFAIKDAESVLSCVMFAGKSRSTGFTPRNGQQVVITGRVDFYKPQGRVSLQIDKIEAVGLGALEQKLRELVEEVRQLGWLEADRKRPLPRFPRRVAVITSRTGAALQDVLNTMKKRCPAVDVAFIDALVQGAAAAPAVTSAINWVSANAVRLGIDALIVTRGGGSIEDLWAFNEKAVAEAIVKCSIPVAAAIGHETDTTLAELVADERCATPTQAAMRLTPDRQSLLEQTDMVQTRLSGALTDRARSARQLLIKEYRHLGVLIRQRAQTIGRRLESLSVRLERQKPSAAIERRRTRVQSAAQRLASAIHERVRERVLNLESSTDDLARAMRVSLTNATQRAAAAERQLDLVGPQAVLARGYSVTLKSDGTVIREPTQAKPGESLVTRLAAGSINSTVNGTAADPLPAQTRIGSGKKKRAIAPDPNQLGLF